jgi:hypothetical protein
MGKLSPLDPFPLLWKLSPQISIVSICSWKYILFIIFNLHHLHITSLGPWPYITFTIYIASLGFENGDVTSSVSYVQMYIQFSSKFEKLYGYASHMVSS